MKLSLKFRDQEPHHPHPQNPLLRAKIPVTILGLPFLSGIIAGDSSDLSFSLRSNFSAGPTLSLSYHPTLPSSSAGNLPFSIALKSGTGVLGSPHDSPLVFTAKFNLFSPNPNPNANPSSLNPIFSLHVKPRFGNFSLSKSLSSENLPSIRAPNGHLPNGSGLANGSGPDFEMGDGLGGGSEKGIVWSDLKRGSSSYGEILSGVLVAARTSMPLTKRALVHFRWGVKLPPEVGLFSSSTKTRLPVLVMNKVSLERLDEGKKVEENDGKKRSFEEGKSGDVEVLKGMCGWMRREVEELQRENRQMKHMLESMRSQFPAPVNPRVRRDERDGVGKRGNVEGSSEFEKWRSKKGNNNGGGNDEESASRDSKKMSEVESELQKAIKAAAASSS